MASDSTREASKPANDLHRVWDGSGWYSSVHVESGPTGTSARNLEADAGETAAQLQRKAVLHSSYLACKRTQRDRARGRERERERERLREMGRERGIPRRRREKVRRKKKIN